MMTTAARIKKLFGDPPAAPIVLAEPPEWFARVMTEFWAEDAKLKEGRGC